MIRGCLHLASSVSGDNAPPVLLAMQVICMPSTTSSIYKWSWTPNTDCRNDTVEPTVPNNTSLAVIQLLGLMALTTSSSGLCTWG